MKEQLKEQQQQPSAQPDKSAKLQRIPYKKMVTFALLLTIPAVMTGCNNYDDEDDDDYSSGGYYGGYYGGSSSKKSSSSGYADSKGSSYKGFGSSGSISSGG